MYLVFDVGATTIKYALMTGEGDITEKGKVTTPVAKGQGVDDFVSTIGNIYDNYKSKLGILEGIAMGLPGQIDVKRGIVYNGGGIQYLHEAHLQELIQNRCDNILVSIENDGKCAALAEIWKGNAKDVKDACVLVFGTGIGGGIIRGRKVIHGKHLLAGEMSFIIDEMERSDLDKLPPGENLMETIRVPSMVQALPYTWTTKHSAVNMCMRIAVAKGLPKEEVTGERVYQWVREGDELVTNMLEDTYFSIAKMCLSLFVILDPEIILIGGGISAEPDFIKGIKKYVTQLKRLSNVYTNVKIDTCKFLNDSNLLGALYNFKQKYARSDESCTA
ncbi:MAG: ROK family protein [Lachnospiraceae bacterium]|nr:ROK family protein [Lachnospiraceae bacterium]